MSERRTSAMLRVPFVRMCTLHFDAGRKAQAFIANINILGAYLAFDEWPAIGEGVLMRFGSAGTETLVDIRGVVAWVNPKQQHPVHSLPPGFGVKFLDLSAHAVRRIESIVEDYVARHPQTAR